MRTALLLALAAATLKAQQSTHPAAPKRTAPTPTTPPRLSSLPVTAVSLYKNGVGFFEHSSQITGNATVSIDFTSSQLNDVLQSLTAIDLGGGHITGAGYNSTTPLEQQLRNLPLALNAEPTVSSFYTALRGAMVEVRSGSTSIRGRLLTIETGAVPTSGHGADATTDSGQHLLLTVVSDSGEVRTVALTTATSVRLIDSGLDASISRYLQLLDENRSQGLRHLTLSDQGEGSRTLRVSYISEVPVWKSTYRILVTAKDAARPTTTLQGWSVIDNTTGSDWINVRLSLIAGAPQSFIQPISQPIYSTRPEIPIAQEAQLRPQTFESGSVAGSGVQGVATDRTGAIIPNANITATNTATGARQSVRTGNDGRYALTLTPGTWNLEAQAPGFQTYAANGLHVSETSVSTLNFPLNVGSASSTVSVNADAATVETNSASVSSIRSGLVVPNGYAAPRAKADKYLGGMEALNAPLPPPPPANYEDLASGSFTATSSGSSFDDFFAYNITTPVTIRKNESALIPTLQSRVEAERVTFVTANNGRISQPLRALWLTNTSGLTLDRGSFTIVENGAFAGEGLLDPIHPNEKRLLSYAADQAIHVAVDNTSSDSRITRIYAAKGVLTIVHGQRSETVYSLRNAAAESRTVVLDNSIRPGFLLDASMHPDETTASAYRFRLTVPAGQTVKQSVSLHRTDNTVISLTGSDLNTFTQIQSASGNNQKLLDALAPVRAAQRKASAADTAVDEVTTRLDNLHKDEDRQRANIAALASADKASRDRFVHDLNATEDKIIAAQKELDDKTEAKDKADEELANLIDSFQFDETL